MAKVRLTRRKAIGVAVGAGLTLRGGGHARQASIPDWAMAPIGWPNRPAGDGFRIGHGFACENTWFVAGWWHTGEDWYAGNGDSAGATIYAVAAGEVVYADFNYPGRVVIIQHAADLYSMYGHLDLALAVETGQAVAAGEVLGVLMRLAPVRGPGQAPSHLHFEMRTFLTRDDINGSSPRNGVNCGFQCPPGPGYWPISASEHPAELGWRNPTHGRFSRMEVKGLELVAHSAFVGQTVLVLEEPDRSSPAVSEIELAEDVSLSVLEAVIGDPTTTETSADAYTAWFRVESGLGNGWVQFAIPSDRETGSDGRPSSLDLPFVISTRAPNS